MTNEFFEDYSHLVEILKKSGRPYSMVKIAYNGYDFAIPFRSNIDHPNALLTDANSRCGLDYSKAILIPDSKYISTSQPIIRQNEFSEYKKK